MGQMPCAYNSLDKVGASMISGTPASHTDNPKAIPVARSSRESGACGMPINKLDTKHLIEASFIELLRDGDFDSITVRDIAQNCGLSFRTFYNHFGDKYELVAWMFSDALTRKSVAPWDRANTRPGTSELGPSDARPRAQGGGPGNAAVWLERGHAHHAARQ